MKNKEDEDIFIRSASPIFYEENIVKKVKVDFLNLNISTYDNDPSAYLDYIYDNGKVANVAKIKVTSENGINKFLISWKGKCVEEEVRNFIEKVGIEAVFQKVIERNPLIKGLAGKERLLVVYKSNKLPPRTLGYLNVDRRKDLEIMADKNPSFEYKIISEKFGIDFDKKNVKEWQKRYPGADWEAIKSIATDEMAEPRLAYRKIAKLFVGKSKTSNSVKVDAKRFLTRVRGDRIWFEN